MADVGQDVLIEARQEVGEVVGSGGWRCGKSVAHRLERLGLQDRAVAQPVDPRDEHVDHGVAHLAHPFWR